MACAAEACATRSTAARSSSPRASARSRSMARLAAANPWPPSAAPTLTSAAAACAWPRALASSIRWAMVERWANSSTVAMAAGKSTSAAPSPTRTPNRVFFSMAVT